MAKRSVVVRNEKRKIIVSKHWKKRQELKAAAINPKLSVKKRQEAQRKLAELPRDSNRIRLRNRCALTGRPRGVYKKIWYLSPYDSRTCVSGTNSWAFDVELVKQRAELGLW